MAQSALTCTPSNPTPPTNFSTSVGTTPPTSPAQTPVDDGSAGTVTVFAPQFVSADSANFPSLPAEGAGTEVTVTAPGSRAECPTIAFSCLGSYTTTPNSQHASSLSPATNPALASISPTSTPSGSGTVTVTCTGTNFTKQSVVYAAGVAVTPTTFTSATTISAPVPKRSSAGTTAITVVTGGAVVTAPQTLTFT